MSDEVKEDVQEDIHDIAQQFQAGKNVQNTDSSDDFEMAETTHCHCNLKEGQVDHLAGKKHKDSTKEQTKWAVRVFRGILHISQSSFK